MPLETRMDGDPGEITAAASWLRSGVVRGNDAAATVVYRQRSLLASAWQGAGGDAFSSRASTLARAADGVAAEAGAAADLLDDIATALRRALRDLADVREDARSADLRVAGTQVLEPIRPPSVGPLGADATPAEVSAYERGVAAISAYERQVAAYERLADRVREIREDWSQRLESAVTTWVSHDDKLVSMVGDLMVGGYSAALLLKLAPVLAGEAAASLQAATRLAQHADAMLRDGRFIGTRAQDYYDLLDRSRAAQARAAQYAAMAEEPKLPKGLTRGLGALSVLTTAYGIHSDIEDGESTEQAVVSNVGGTLAGIGAGAAGGAAIGAGVGSVVPVAGTAVGAVGGAIIGTGVGIVTSGAIDSIYENGVDGIGDVGDAIGDGVEDLTDFGGDLADGAAGLLGLD